MEPYRQTDENGNIWQMNANGGRVLVGKAPTPAPTGLNAQYGVYNQAVKQQAGDYGNIMGNLNNLLSTAQSTAGPLSTPQANANTYAYQPSQSVANSISNLAGLTSSGGYSAGDAQNIRSRAVSPIRSVYASANRDIDRNRALRGGNAPGFQAAKAKMAREMSQNISDASINAEASIAGDIARNKIAIAPAFASAAGAESSMRNQYGSKAVDDINSFTRLNSQLPLDYAASNRGATNNAADIMRQMTSLYGTTPALASLYGGQALSSAQFQNIIDQQQRTSSGKTISDILSSLGGSVGRI